MSNSSEYYYIDSHRQEYQNATKAQKSRILDSLERTTSFSRSTIAKRLSSGASKPFSYNPNKGVTFSTNNFSQPHQKPTLKHRWQRLPKKARTWIIVILAIIAIYLISLLTGCSPQTIETVITKQVEVTREVEVIQTVIVMATPIPPTETPIPTNTPEPTIKPPTPTPASNPESIAKNVAITQEQNGVEVILERVLIADPNSEVGLKHRDDEYLKNKSVYLQPIIKITNNTDRLIKMFFVGDIIVQANDEQISYNNFINIFYMPEYSKDVLPGATVRGPVWVGMNRHKWNQITKVVVRIPHFESNEIKITEDFIFEVEVGDWGFEPLPDHLKN